MAISRALIQEPDFAVLFNQPLTENHHQKASTHMSHVLPCAVPAHSFLRKYHDGVGFADCYCVEVGSHVTQAEFIAAFYTSPLFKLERTLLKLLASRPASDADAALLANGQVLVFSAWKVEAQTASELLLADFTGPTRSWLMTEQVESAGVATRLYFGAAVVPRIASAGKANMGWIFTHYWVSTAYIQSCCCAQRAGG